jgi:uncharacterized protein YcbX
MHVAELWRYPVKSLQGESVPTVDLVTDGVAGDRQWGLRDVGTGRILTARRRPELLMAAATADAAGGAPHLGLPDGTVTAGAGEDTDAALSSWLGAPVSLVPAADTDPGRAEYFADATDDTSQAIEWTMPQDRYVDAAAVLVLTTSSLRTAADLHGDGDWHPRRFRPNVLLDTDGDGWLEDGWVGRPVAVGSAVLVPSQPCVRCTMVTRAQPGIAADVDIFRTLARHHGGLFGVWCDVRTPGRIAVGDPATPGQNE